jgi:hypothetical protein
VTALMRCHHRSPVYRYNSDGRKPLRCDLCGRRVFRRRPLHHLFNRVLPWLAWHFPRVAEWLVLR